MNTARIKQKLDKEPSLGELREKMDPVEADREMSCSPSSLLTLTRLVGLRCSVRPSPNYGPHEASALLY